MDLLDGLDEFQRVAVTHDRGPLLVIAGPGSGKTRVLTRRAAWLVARGIPPSNILITAFNKEAAGEMDLRLNDLLGPQLPKVDCRTIHSACLYILRSVDPAMIGRRKPEFQILKNPNLEISKIARAIAEPLARGRELIHDTQLRLGMDRMTRRILLAKEYRLTPQKLAQRNLWGAYALQVYVEYERHLERENLVDFSGFLSMAADLLEGHADVRERFQQKWTHVLVDEYQDVSPAQEAVFYNLCMTSRNITAVGDADQAIYGFRGGTPEAMLDFNKRWPDSTLVELPVNYRSTQNVVKTSQQVIRNNRKRFDYEARTPNESGPVVAIHVLSTQENQAKRVVSMIEQWKGCGERLSEIAVLYRTRRESRLLELNLFSTGIHYRLLPKSDPGFYGRKETLDIIAWIKLLLNPDDNEAFERAIQAPRRGVGDSTLKKIKTAAGKSSLYRCTLAGGYGWVHERVQVGLDSFVDAVENLRNTFEQEERGSVVGDILVASGYESWADANQEDGDEGDIINTLHSFEDAYLEFIGGKVLTRGRALAEFLAQLRAQTDAAQKAKSGAANSECVTLSTMHSAKGKEFTNVVIVNCYEGNTPLVSLLNKTDPSNIEDERRLFYVGMTRCRKNLNLLFPQTATKKGSRKDTELSRFVLEAEDREVPIQLPPERPPIEVPLPEELDREDIECPFSGEVRES